MSYNTLFYIQSIPWIYKKYGFSDKTIAILTKCQVKPNLWYKGFTYEENQAMFKFYLHSTWDQEFIQYYMDTCLKYQLVPVLSSMDPYLVIKHCNYETINKYFDKRSVPTDLAPCGNLDGLKWCLEYYYILPSSLCLGDNLSCEYLTMLSKNKYRFNKNCATLTFIKHNALHLVKGFVKCNEPVYIKPETINDFEYIKSVLAEDVYININPESCIKLLRENIHKTINLTSTNVYSDMRWESLEFIDYYPYITHLCNPEFPCKVVNVDRSQWTSVLDLVLQDNQQHISEILAYISNTYYNSVLIRSDIGSVHINLSCHFSFYISNEDTFLLLLLTKIRYKLLKDIYVNNVKVDFSDFVR